MTEQDHRRLGAAALEAGRWEEARAAFAAALAEREPPRPWTAWAWPCGGLARPGPASPTPERAYAEFRRAGEAVPAAVAAMSLCITWVSNFDNHAAAGGWLARAERVLGELDPNPLRGLAVAAAGLPGARRRPGPGAPAAGP